MSNRLQIIIITKAAHSPQLFKTLSVGPVWDSNPRPSAQQTGALPTELTELYNTPGLGEVQ